MLLDEIRGRLADFLRTLMSCDGTIYNMNGYPRIEFTVASEALARDVYHAFLRFGVVSKFWQQAQTSSWRVEVTAPEEVSRYQRFIGWIGEKTTRFPHDAFAADPDARHAMAGGAPQAAWDLVRAATRRAGITIQLVVTRTNSPTWLRNGTRSHWKWKRASSV